jgi:DNA (cytosine-5)-methyltransferase 1
LIAFGGGNQSEPIDVATTLQAHIQRGDMDSETFVTSLIPFDTTQITSKSNISNPRLGDPCHPLAAGAHAPAIAFQERGRDGGRSLEYQEDVACSLRVSDGGGSASMHTAFAYNWTVRRLMPVECERLQGFPDGYTTVPYRGKTMSDGPRYFCLGNSIAVNCLRWIGLRIELVRRLVGDIA